MRDASEGLKGREPLAPEQYFSEGYAEARRKFRLAAEVLGAEQPVRLDTLMVKEPDYTMDVAVVQGTAGRGLAVHSSGVHGVEGFAGSAIQTAILHGMFCSGIRPESTCVFVHAVNPYGMAHFRRFNENNVDLNRNALTAEGWREVLARDPNLAGYEDFRDLFVASAAPMRWSVLIGLWVRSLYLICRYGVRHLKRAMVAATYHHAKGIFFGGHELQPSHRILSDYIKRHFGDTPGNDVGWVDVHTGLGPSGVDVLLCGGQDCRAAAEGFPGASVQSTDGAGSAGGDQSAGYDLTRGLMEHMYRRVFKNSEGAPEALIVTQEFGTVPPIVVARSLIIENRGYHFDFANHERWRAYTRDAFYVRQPAWKRSVLGRGRAVFGQLLRAVSGRPRP